MRLDTLPGRLPYGQDVIVRVNEPKDGCLFWGGPAHNTIIPVSQHIHIWDVPASGGNGIDRVTYQSHRWGVKWGDTLYEEWFVYVPRGDDEAHRALKAIVRLMQEIPHWFCHKGVQ